MLRVVIEEVNGRMMFLIATKIASIKMRAAYRVRWFVVCFVCITCSAAIASDTRLAFGTGGERGVYYPAGLAICKFVERNGFRCRAKATKGSPDNLARLRRGKLDLIVARSDWALRALNGTEKFENAGPYRNLRSLFSLHSEPLFVLARHDAKIRNLKDLRGKRINIGSPASEVAARFLPALGWSSADFAAIGNLGTKDQGQALCRDRFDVAIYTVGVPSGRIEEALRQCPLNLVNLNGRGIDRLVSSSDELSKVTIPRGIHYGQETPIETFGYRATILSRTEVSDEVIYEVVKSTFENLDRLRTLHPAWSNLQQAEMINESLVAPLHPGAIKYYRERGWIK